MLDEAKHTGSTVRKTIRLSDRIEIDVYPRSIVKKEDDYLFVGMYAGKKYLWILSWETNQETWKAFDGEGVAGEIDGEDLRLKRCVMDHHNATLLRDHFSYTAPTVLGPGHSIGLGDRLGLAGPGHIRAVEGTPVKAILAQQSIRELTRTERTPEEVIDAATWAVFQEGFRDGFGADADHLKSKEDIDLTVQAGYTMYTIDPGDHVDNDADSCSVDGLKEKVNRINWSGLEDSLEDCEGRYVGRDVVLGDAYSLKPGQEEVYRAIAKYGWAILHTYAIYQHLCAHMGSTPFELEVSVDESDSVTSPFEHYFIASELNRLGVSFVSLAPRFVGDFEKGIDYKGDLKVFEEEYKKHILISRHCGSYKISFHSGSDKFSVYDIAGNIEDGDVHVKTAGTSYLVALQAISLREPDLSREILDFSRSGFNVNKATYHISADIEHVPQGSACSDEQLHMLFDDDDARQVLHVGFGSVLTAKGKNGLYRFRDRILDCLKTHEDTHYDYLEKHIRRHVSPFV